MRASLFCTYASVTNAFSYSKKAFLSADLQPEVVAHTLVKVEDEWRAQAASFAECNVTLTAEAETAECGSATSAFQRSCSTVVDAVVRASSGDRSHVKEYMGVVCGEVELSGWHQERCGELAQSVYDSMSDDNYENRESFNVANLCTGFWSRFTKEEKVRVDQERSEREAAEKKAEDERVEAEKQAATLAAEEQQRKEKEEAEERVQEVRRQAEEAADALKAKKEEAERQAEEAKHKMEEAQAAAEVAAQHHREVLANATAMAEAANVNVNVTLEVNATNSTPVVEAVVQNVTEQPVASVAVNSSAQNVSVNSSVSNLTK